MYIEWIKNEELADAIDWWFGDKSNRTKQTVGAIIQAVACDRVGGFYSMALLKKRLLDNTEGACK